MRKKILIIDDSALMRRVTSDIIESDANFEVADIAINGLQAYEFVLNNLNKYDAAILDINMPRLNGIEFLKRLEKDNIKLKCIVSSTVAKEGAKITIEALECGAFDFITKPNTYTGCKNSDFAKNLITKLKVACDIDDEKSDFKTFIKTDNIIQPPRKTITRSSGTKKLVIIASSTGGPRALQKVIPLLPKNLDAPVIVVQHMPREFTASLAERLNNTSNLKVKEAQDGEVLKKGYVYIAKGGHRNTVLRKPDGASFHITKGEKEILKPSADIFIDSVIDTNYDDIVCAVLTGMGNDATRGIVELKRKKDVYIISQDKETCVVYGMPKTIAETGLVNSVLPLEKIAQKIIDNTGVR